MRLLPTILASGSSGLTCALLLARLANATPTPLFYDGAMAFISNANAAVPSSAVASPSSSSGVTPSNNNNGSHGFSGHTVSILSTYTRERQIERASTT